MPNLILLLGLVWLAVACLVGLLVGAAESLGGRREVSGIVKLR